MNTSLNYTSQSGIENGLGKLSHLMYYLQNKIKTNNLKFTSIRHLLVERYRFESISATEKKLNLSPTFSGTSSVCISDTLGVAVLGSILLLSSISFIVVSGVFKGDKLPVVSITCSAGCYKGETGMI